MKGRWVLTLVAYLAILAGCSDDLGVDEIYDESLTIEQGIAGVFTSQGDIDGDDGTSTVAGAEILVFSEDALVDGEIEGNPDLSITTSDDGFYEVGLPDGIYYVAYDAAGLTHEEATVNARVVRCDLSTSVAGPEWSCR